MHKFVSAGLFTLAVGCAQQPATSQVAQELGADRIPNNLPLPNPSGLAATYNVNDKDVDLTGDFFTSFGTNGRVCGTCHLPTDGWSVIPSHIQARFDATGGTDPIFRLVDGANSPNADVSTVDARREAYSMLLSRGVIRIGIGVPSNSEFDLVGVDDPYNFASSAQLSLFRRPLQSSNLDFLSTVMWDGRETLVDTSNPPLPGDNCLKPPFAHKCFLPVIPNDLMHQAVDATLGHAQAMVPGLTTEQEAGILEFETGLSFAQEVDSNAGRLDSAGAIGGAEAIPGFAAYFGINDNFGDYKTGAPFTADIFSLYNAWAGYDDATPRAAIARGQALFNSKPITISGVAGLNGSLGLPASFSGTCGTCHDAPEGGDHSVPAPLNIGVADASRRTSDMPLYTLQCNATGISAHHCSPGQQAQTTDPGRSLITGAWADIGKFKGPTLRGIAARAPYFHNGSVSDLGGVVDFYDTRFGIGFTSQERSDLIAFLGSL
jgi:hypothetical protein